MSGKILIFYFQQTSDFCFKTEKGAAEGKQFGFGFGGIGLPSFLPIKPGYYNLGQIHNKIPNSEEITKVIEPCLVNN